MAYYNYHWYVPVGASPEVITTATGTYTDYSWFNPAYWWTDVTHTVHPAIPTAIPVGTADYSIVYLEGRIGPFVDYDAMLTYYSSSLSGPPVLDYDNLTCTNNLNYGGVKLYSNNSNQDDNSWSPGNTNVLTCYNWGYISDSNIGIGYFYDNSYFEGAFYTPSILSIGYFYNNSSCYNAAIIFGYFYNNSSFNNGAIDYTSSLLSFHDSSIYNDGTGSGASDLQIYDSANFYLGSGGTTGNIHYPHQRVPTTDPGYFLDFDISTTYLGYSNPLYWKSTNGSTDWHSPTNWIIDSDCLIQSEMEPDIMADAIITGSTSPIFYIDDFNYNYNNYVTSILVKSLNISAGLTISTRSLDGELIGSLFYDIVSVRGPLAINGNLIANGYYYTVILNINWDHDVTFNNGGTLGVSKTITGNAVFNTSPSSHTASKNNIGIVTGNAIFNGASINGTNSRINGYAEFRNNSVNKGRVYGNAYVYYPQPKPFNGRTGGSSGGQVDGTIYYIGYDDTNLGLYDKALKFEEIEHYSAIPSLLSKSRGTATALRSYD